MSGLIEVPIAIWNIITNAYDNVKAQGTELDNGITYFEVDNKYRKLPNGDVEVYYPDRNRWAKYEVNITPPSDGEALNSYTPSQVAYATSGGSGSAPTTALETAIQIGIDIAQNNLYGYNWGGGNYANYEGRCGGWYAYLHNLNEIATGTYNFVAGDFDCSSFIAFLLWSVGIFPGQMSNWFNTVTDNLDARLRNNGFTKHTIANEPKLQMQRGDILLKQGGSRSAGTYWGHTAMCIGSGEIVHAKSDSFGDPNNTQLQKMYKQRGDYLGHELRTEPSALSSWMWLYRWE